MPENIKSYPEFANGKTEENKEEINYNLWKIDVAIKESEEELRNEREKLKRMSEDRNVADNYPDGGDAEYAEQLRKHIEESEILLEQTRILRMKFQDLLGKYVRQDEEEKGILEVFESKNIQ
ncbi:MAG: hypothetical protein U0944_00880 [Candidatus Moranbacteria bacterium]|nr:hypothetical protein [Candidatus Moranbacteria bacterium]MDZ4384953.1 hypothetical protein [Candidatus Moranbacteria bacterium]